MVWYTRSVVQFVLKHVITKMNHVMEVVLQVVSVLIHNIYLMEYVWMRKCVQVMYVCVSVNIVRYLHSVVVCLYTNKQKAVKANTLQDCMLLCIGQLH